MKAPRDFQAELDALNAKAKHLKARRVEQLGQLVLTTGADALPLDVLAGILLSAVKELNAGSAFKEDYAALGSAFFSRGRGKAGGKASAERPALRAVPEDAA